MLRWSVLFTLALAALLTLSGFVLGGKSQAFRAVFFSGLALWQSAMTVSIYCRDRKRVRADCLGVGVISVLVTIVYMLVRYPLSWRPVAAGTPVVLAIAIGGAWLAWRASEARAVHR